MEYLLSNISKIFPYPSLPCISCDFKSPNISHASPLNAFLTWIPGCFHKSPHWKNQSSTCTLHLLYSPILPSNFSNFSPEDLTFSFISSLGILKSSSITLERKESTTKPEQPTT